MSSRAEMVERAVGYPYDLPTESYAMVDGQVTALDGAAWSVSDRVPILAYGSNASPSQLRRKFAGESAGCVIPVVMARLRGFDVVYSAHVSTYGAVPATLIPRDGTSVQVAMTLLSPTQAQVMLRSEGGNYDEAEVDRKALESDLPREGMGAPRVYVSRFGALGLEGRPVALQAVPASGRSLGELTEREMLERVVAALEPTLDVEGFIVMCNRDEGARRAWVRQLARWAIDPPRQDASER